MDRSYEAEFAELVAAKGAALRRTAYLMCGDWHLAEDLVQAAFVKIHLHWRRLRRQESFDAYLRTVLFHAYLIKEQPIQPIGRDEAS
ncbi:DNA-directed RNA polymerase specialized sigma24 family protein [Catenulispora sp. MAP5-51]|uniref:sigma factor n=1 Tax=Catenulispora sp. MAP5-51 TaxID=3156298 RepID=UPI0035168E98